MKEGAKRNKMSPSNDNSGLSKGEVWKDLAVRAQQGDKRAYAQLLHELVPFIKSVISGSLANQDWVEDIVQDVLISVHKSLSTYSGDRPFKPWVMSIIRFRKADLLRKYYKDLGHKKVSTENMEYYKQHVTDPGAVGELKDIEAALASLPEKQRKVFEMIKIHGYSTKEVAKEMGMSVSAVKVSAHRTMNKLRDRLK